MALTTAGRNFIATAIMNSGPPTFYDNSNAYLGVGNSNTAFAVGQTDLQGGSDDRKGMEATYPQIATNVLTLKSSFNDDNSQFAWEEWGVFNNSTGGTMLSRLVESLGTKGAGQTWDLTVDITVNIGS
jgi:hypothetical protein